MALPLTHWAGQACFDEGVAAAIALDRRAAPVALDRDIYTCHE